MIGADPDSGGRQAYPSDPIPCCNRLVRSPGVTKSAFSRLIVATRTVPAVSPRVRYVDGLRAVAVLSVVLFHATKYLPAFALHSGPATFGLLGVLKRVLSLGFHGVDLFFVISGYCLAYPTLSRFRNRGRMDFSIPHYLTRRIVRILPPYEIALACFVLMLALFAWRGWHAPADMLAPLDIGNVVRDALLLDRDTSHVNQSFWSLAIELRWYFVFPVALIAWIRWPRALWLAIGICVLLNLTTLAGSGDIACLPAFLLGIIAVDLELRRPNIIRFFPALLAIAIAGALLFPVSSTVPVSIFWQIALFAFVVLAGSTDWLRAALSIPALFEIGIASYSIYLVHQPVVALIAVPLSTRIANPWIALFATVGIGITVGFAFWYCIERSFTAEPAKLRLEAMIRPMFDWLFEGLRLSPEISVESPFSQAEERQSNGTALRSLGVSPDAVVPVTQKSAL
jgi:peptidoglycan/LPS O-acetylase OafA/YrhL